MNEELLAYAILSASGFDTKQMFEEKLNQLFIETSDINPDLLEMECMSIPDAMAYLRHHYQNFNEESLQKYLILTLKAFYLHLPFMEFVQKIVELWDILPFHTSHEDSPFYMAYYFLDLLVCEEFELLKQDIEELVFYYDNSKHP